jgi:hypothetical protein
MTAFFQLIDATSGNVIRDYVTEDDALDDLRGVARNDGLEEIGGLALLRFEEDHPTLVAMGDGLIARLNIASLVVPRT